jgi:chromosome segregation ATPase
MSQLETILWFALGFAVASLLALFLGRAAWRSGVRLGARRMARKVPGTVSELQTERDSMRAENAMMARKLEVRMGEMKARLAEQSAEVSRHRNRIEVLVTDLARREKRDESNRAEISRLLEQIAAFEGDITQRTDTVQLTSEKLRAKDALIDQQADEIAALKSRIWKLQTKAQPIEERLAEAGEESDKLAAEIRALDQAWPEKLTELGFADREAAAEAQMPVEPVNGTAPLVDEIRVEPSPAPAQPQSRLAGNVISLAQRFKALQKTITR